MFSEMSFVKDSKEGLIQIAIIIATTVIFLIVKTVKKARRKAEQKRIERKYGPNFHITPVPDHQEDDKPEEEFLTVEQIKEDMKIGRHVARYGNSLKVEEIDRLIDAGFKPIAIDSYNDEYWFWKPGEKPAERISEPIY